LPNDSRLDRIHSALLSLEKTFKSIKLEIPPQKEIKIPDFPKVIQTAEGKAIIEGLRVLAKAIGELPDKIKIPRVEFPGSISVDNFPVPRYPLPPTNININSLRGPVLATQVTVGPTATRVPASALANRRSLIIFNNSIQTVFLGDENVNTDDGMPVPADQYSPPMDIGDRVSLYGIVASGTADVRIFEVSMDEIGS